MPTTTDLAYLILGHTDPAHLARLIGSLDSDRARFFIHIDKKSDIGRFANLATDNVHFCENRINCAWGDFSLIEATLALVKQALDHPAHLKRLTLLSGACLPVQPVRYIEAFFDAHPTDEFIEWFEFPNVNYGKPLSRVENYWLRRNIPPLARQLKVGSIQARIQSFINKRMPKRDYQSAFEGLSLYTGSQWWALTRAAAEYAMSAADPDRAFYNFVKNTDCPDEFFFQTVLANSAFSTQLRHSLTYASWEAGATGPEAISSKHLGALSRPTVHSAKRSNSPAASSEVLFARKFSSELPAIVDAVLLANRDKDRPDHCPTAPMQISPAMTAT